MFNFFKPARGENVYLRFLMLKILRNKNILFSLVQIKKRCARFGDIKCLINFNLTFSLLANFWHVIVFCGFSNLSDIAELHIQPDQQKIHTVHNVQLPVHSTGYRSRKGINQHSGAVLRTFIQWIWTEIVYYSRLRIFN